MKPAPFVYHAPTSVEEACALLSELGDDAKVLAGGQSLVPMLNLRLTSFAALVDIGRVASLRTVERTSSMLTVGSMVPQCAVEDRADIGAVIPMLRAATRHIGHFQIRNRGTLGGSLAHADPAAEYPAVALALDAELVMVSRRGTRTVTAADFFTGTWTTSSEADELLVGCRFPIWPAGSGFAVEEVARRRGDFAMAGAAVGIRVVAGVVTQAAVALFGMGSTPLRSDAAEQALVGQATGVIDAADVGRLAVDATDPPDDLHASRDLRRRIGATAVTRAVRRALEEAGVG